jgi:hypothetical protein
MPSDDLSDRINHFIEAHGYRLLHVGTETSHDSNGNPWHSTVAVLGHDDPPALAQTRVVIGGPPPDLPDFNTK